MARGREQVTLETGFTISLVAEIHLRCIRRTTVPWPYVLRLGSMTCQNDRSENSNRSVTNFVCFGKNLDAENGLQNCVSDDLVVGVHSSSVYHPTVSSPTDRYCDNDVQNNVT